MNDVWIKFIEQAPWAAAYIFTVYMFLNFISKSEDKRMEHEKALEDKRIDAAKEREKERREHEATIANMQAQNMKQLLERQEATFETIAQALSEHEKASKERYDRMGITKDLIAAVKEEKDKRR